MRLALLVALTAVFFGASPPAAWQRAAAKLKVGTAKTDLYRYCEDTGCAKVKLGYLLLWHRSGDQLVLITRGLTVKQVLEVATSMRLVPG